MYMYIGHCAPSWFCVCVYVCVCVCVGKILANDIRFVKFAEVFPSHYTVLTRYLVSS